MKKLQRIAPLLFVMIMLACGKTSYAATEQFVQGDSLGDLNVQSEYEETEMIHNFQKDIDKYSESQIENIMMKKKIIEGDYSEISLSDNKGISLLAEELIVKLDVEVVTQKNGYYCGPATTRQTLKYINGSAPSQDTIAEALGTTTAGTDGTKIVEYINKKQDKVVYMISSDLSVIGMQSKFANTMNANRVPIIGRLKFTTADGWPYSTNGHFLNVTGYTTGMNKLRITDPNAQRAIEGSSGHYRIDFEKFRTATKNHFSQHYYW